MPRCFLGCLRSFSTYFILSFLSCPKLLEMDILPALALHLSCFLPSNPLSLRHLRFLFIFLFTILISWLPCYCDGECETFTCGFYSLQYPFGKKNSGCGDPALQLECDEYQGMPLLNIRGGRYYILQPKTYFQGNSYHNMTIIDKNLWGDECNPSSSNYTAQFWSSHQFHIAYDFRNMSLWSQCGKESTEYLSTNAYNLECGVNDWYFIPNSSWSKQHCKSLVSLPVRQDPEHIRLLNPSNLKEFLQNGFEIKWNFSKGCEDCVPRNGFCNYNTALTQVYCNTSSSGNTVKVKSKTTIIALVSSIAGVALAAGIVLGFIYYWRRRSRPPTLGVPNRFSNYKEMEVHRPQHGMHNVSIFSYQELQQATNFFDEKNEIGDGGSGSVYVGKLKDGRTVAVKRLYQDNCKRVEQFINEVHILSTLRHPNLVQLYGCTYPESPVLLLVYEFVANGTLADHLHGNRRTLKGLLWEIRLNIAIEIAQALAFLHGVFPPIYHRDVKSTNILIDENFRAKVADFGLSRLVPVDVSHVTTAPQGTPGYVDPDYHQRFQLTDKSDVYSFGVVLVELISAKVAVDTKRSSNEISLAYMALDKIRTGALEELVDPDLKIEKNPEVKLMVSAVAELSFACLATDRDVRPDMREVAARLEEIKQLQNKSNRGEQDSLTKESTRLLSVMPPVSPISVHEKWPSASSERSS